MGVIIKTSSVAVGQVQEISRAASEESLNSITSSSTVANTVELQNVTVRSHHRSQLRPCTYISRLEPTTSRKRTGARKTRRIDNARMLQTLAEDEATENFVDDSALDITDFKPNTNSPLSKLMTSFSSMRIWQYFISHSEEQQQKYLEIVSESHSTNKGPNAHSSREIEEQALSESSSKENEEITRRPFADKRFEAISSDLKRFLKKQAPLSLVSMFESEVVRTFKQNSGAVYLSDDVASFERLILHGISQYHLLKSFSIEISGQRRTKIVNKLKDFIPPQKSLSEYLEMLKQFH